MSTVDKLHICGVRSFGPEDNDKAIIKLCTPLTLILGQNGCGKTTIIEALKYAISGDLPSDHTAFVHDPKLSKLVETRAQVKLRCKNTKGKKITVCRTMRVLQKAKKMEFKTLDSTISDEQGNNTSAKCSDIDDLMCHEMGTSKVILNDVIFCHQEDSDWPLADKGKKMKDKFDAIFGITEYNRCLDHIRDLTKNMVTERSILAKDVEYKEEVKNDAAEKKQNLSDVNLKLAANKDHINELDNKIRPIEDQLDEITRKELDITKYFTEVQNAENRKKLLIETQNDLRKSIQEEFTGSEEDLQNSIKTFEQRLQDKENSLIKLEKEKDNISKDELQLQQKMNRDQMKLGQLQQDHRQHEDRVDKCSRDLNSLADDLGLPTVENLQVNEPSGSELLTDIENKIKYFSTDLTALQEEQENIEKSMQKNIDDCRVKKTTLEYDVKTKKNQIVSNKSEIEKVKAKISEVDRSATTLVQLESQLQQVSKELENLSKLVDVEQLKQEIEKNISKRNKLDTSLNRLDEEVKTLQLLSIEQSELDKLKRMKQNLEGDIKILRTKHEASLQHLLENVPNYGIDKELQACIDRLSQEIRDKQSAITSNENKKMALQTKKTFVAEKLMCQNRILMQNEDSIFDACRNQDLNDVLNDVNKKIDDAQFNKGLHTSSEYVFKRYISKLKDTDPSCPICHRGFENEHEAHSVIDDLTHRLQDLPAKLNQSKQELDTLLYRQSQLLQLKPTYDNMSKLKNTEIPALKAEITNIDSEIDTLSKAIDNQKSELMGPESDEAIAKSIQSDIIIMEQHQLQLKTISQDISRLESKLPPAGSVRTLQEAVEEQDHVKSSLSALRVSLESDQNKLSNHNEKTLQLRQKKNAIIEEQYKLKGGAQQRKVFSDKLDELQTLESVLQVELEEATEQLTPMVKKMENMDKEIRKLKLDQKIALEKRRKKMDEYERRLEDIRNLHSIILEYIRKGGRQKLDEAYSAVAESTVRKDSLTQRIKSLQDDIDSSKEFISNQKMRKMDLDNNLKLIQKRKDEVELDENIKRLKGRMGNIDVHNLSKEKRKLQTELTNLNSQKSRAEGRQSELGNQATQIEKELNTARYKNSESDYKNCTYQFKVKSLAIEDLRHYYKAMDWAMIHFHKERMTAINSIIRDLWRQIYRGNDIDCIEIQMDEMTGGDRRRSYNYRVVQFKNGVELDMAGRCSAGQKVLACLIIRMALAETFSKNCGILALDEPTTNLDRENIESLSIALTDIVNSRTIQRSFQLIVITHDEEFLTRLFRVDNVDRYLKVFRDYKGKSRVQELRLPN